MAYPRYSGSNEEQHQETEVPGSSTDIRDVNSKAFNAASDQELGYVGHDHMYRPAESSGNHHYSTINVYGNARAVIGNSYGDLQGFSLVSQEQRPALKAVDALSSELGIIVTGILELFDTSKASIKESRRLKKAPKYTFEIGVRKTIFKTAIQTLLFPSTGTLIAEQMLLDARHPNWSAHSMLQYLGQRLHGSTDTLRKLLDLIDSDLMSVTGFVRSPLLSGHDSAQSIVSPLKSSQLHVKSAEEHHITQDTVVKALRDLNSHVIQFQTHLQQCAEQQERVHVSEPGAVSKLRVSRYQRIQEAAQDLYHAFGQACQQHPSHRARLHLQALSQSPSQVQFSLLVEKSSGVNSGTSIPDITFLRLMIESQVNGTIHADFQHLDACAPKSHHPSLKRARQISSDQVETERVPGVSQRHVSFAVSTKAVELPSLPQARGNETLPNFCVSGRFCFHTKNIQSHENCNNLPLGYFHNQGSSKHLIYLQNCARKLSPHSSHPPQLRSGDKLSPLRNLFQAAEQGHRMSKTNLSSFAKQLAIAVLQYHATPWLESWSSEHVLVDDQIPFFGRSKGILEYGSTPVPTDSYLEVSIDNPSMTTRTPVTDRSRTLIRNWIVFSLGVMLLELAYQRPLCDLQEPHDVDLHNEHNTTYFTADRLQKRMAADTGMGSVYAELVRKCIQCDFGHGSDLTVSKLQEGYYEDVIQKLEDIETGMKNLGL